MCNQIRTYAAKSLLGLCLSLVLCPVFAQDSGGNSVQWKTMIGVIMPLNEVGNGDTVIPGGGQPWSTTGGEAKVNLQNGEVHFNVRGLVLAGGDNIGTPGAITMVVGALVCDTNGDRNGGSDDSLVFNTEAVELDAEGDAKFDGAFSFSEEQLADFGVCSTEAGSDVAFLIRNATSGTPGSWFANGAVLLRHGEDD